MIPKDIKPILQGLLERSRKREVEWLDFRSSGYSGHGDFMVLFANSSVVVWENNHDGELGGRVFNNRGEVVVAFEASSHDDPEYELLKELIDLARRKVLRADETLAEIQKAIETKPRVGEVPRKTSAIDDDEEVPF